MKSVLVAFFLIVSMQITQAQPKLGAKAPEIALPDSKGEIVALSSLKGKVVVLDFWASWCGPCRKSNKEMRAVYNAYKDKGVEVYSVSFDTNERSWKKAIEQDEMTWIHVIDKSPAGHDMTNAYAVTFIPATFIIDKEGTLKAYASNSNEVKKWVKKLLAP